MEVIEVCQKRRQQYRPATCPSFGKKCSTTRRYIQPARVESYAPERSYCPPTKPLEANTTYHLSYLNSDSAANSRPVPFRPKQSIENAGGKFEDGTTNKLSYQPIWEVVKPKPIVPCRRTTLAAQGPMQCESTARHDFSPKIVEKPQVIIPCGNIRTSRGVLDASTTAGLSYMNPGCVPRPASFKPTARYCPPKEPTSNDTTQKLSYQPFRVTGKEIYPWALKPLYKPPTAAMDGNTTYSRSFYADETVPEREKPFAPRSMLTLPSEEFVGRTVYNESFLPCEGTTVVPVIPSDNIALSNDKMACATTNKLSYQPVCMEKRLPIRPCMRKMTNDGPMQCETTNRHDFVAKAVGPRPEVVVPCDNIRTCENVPLEDRTTSGLSYLNPGPILPVQSFKPQTQYCRPTAKIECETVNKLSYQSWKTGPRRPLPRKNEYEPPKERMAGDTIYHMSFPAPGYYVEDDCEPEICDATSHTSLAEINNPCEH